MVIIAIRRHTLDEFDPLKFTMSFFVAQHLISCALEKNVYLVLLDAVFYKCQLHQTGWSYGSDLLNLY